MAPLAATIAAGVAVRVGIAIARAGSERRSARMSGPDPRLGLKHDEASAEGLRRMLLAQADLAIGSLESTGTREQRERAVHETRKAIKRIRALLRLLREELGERLYARENAALRELTGELAGARDAEVMLATFEKLTSKAPKRLRRGRGVHRLRKALEAEQERARRELFDGEAKRQRAIQELTAFRARASTWSIDPSGRSLERSTRRLYEQGRRRYRRARQGKRPHTTRMHEWRKRVKDLRYACEALRRERSPSSGFDRSGTSKEARWLQRTAERADELSELLGQEHDLAVLEAWIRKPVVRDGSDVVSVGRRSRKELLKLIGKRRQKLRARALEKGKRLYRHSGKQFCGRLRAARR